jgi:hypothetical protein
MEVWLKTRPKLLRNRTTPRVLRYNPMGAATRAAVAHGADASILALQKSNNIAQSADGEAHLTRAVGRN